MKCQWRAGLPQLSFVLAPAAQRSGQGRAAVAVGADSSTHDDTGTLVHNNEQVRCCYACSARSAMLNSSGGVVQEVLRLQSCPPSSRPDTAVASKRPRLAGRSTQPEQARHWELVPQADQKFASRPAPEVLQPGTQVAQRATDVGSARQQRQAHAELAELDAAQILSRFGVVEDRCAACTVQAAESAPTLRSCLLSADLLHPSQLCLLCKARQRGAGVTCSDHG